MAFVKNLTGQPQWYTFQLSFEGGLYVLSSQEIGPRQTVAVDARALRDGQVPDVNGATIAGAGSTATGTGVAAGSTEVHREVDRLRLLQLHRAGT